MLSLWVFGLAPRVRDVLFSLVFVLSPFDCLSRIGMFMVFGRMNKAPSVELVLMRGRSSW